MKQNIHIAATRNLRPETKNWAERHNLAITDVDFLFIELLPNALAHAVFDAPLVFTSAHAVAAYVQQLGSGAGKTCYAIGGNTKNEALQAGFALAGDAKDGASLAQVILANGEKKVTHLCGNIRRNELRQSLQSRGVLVDEIEVYHKTLSPKKIENFDAVLFFSPSQIDAFLQANTLAETVPAFCIGETTANHLKKLGHKMVFIADEANEKSVLQLALTYFRAP